MLNLKYLFSGIVYAMDLRRFFKSGIFSTLVHAYLKPRIYWHCGLAERRVKTGNHNFAKIEV